MKPYKHQVEISLKAFQVLKQYGLVYLAMEERTGKTLTSILLAEKTNRKNILVITKKKALKDIKDKNLSEAKNGWAGTLNAYIGKPLFETKYYATWLDSKKNKYYTIINYESLHKLDINNFDLAIIDEAHSNLSAYPRVSETWKAVYKIVRGLPIIYLSATPSAQTYAQLYHQLKLSSWGPWKKYNNFYKWFEEYGILETKFLGGRQLMVYTNVPYRAFEEVKHLFISYTRKELGFEHEPNDIVHYVDLEDTTKKLYNELLKNKCILDLDYLADTPMKLLVGLHQLEGGTLKINEDNSIFTKNREKIQYIKENFGDKSSLVIFYHYKQEKELLEANFKYATILQATSFAEGVDLSDFETLIVYSMDFSTARYTQRRARQCNMKRGEPINVHFILVKGGISEQVYETVAVNKKNFVNSYFNREEL